MRHALAISILVGNYSCMAFLFATPSRPSSLKMSVDDERSSSRRDLFTTASNILCGTIGIAASSTSALMIKSDEDPPYLVSVASYRTKDFETWYTKAIKDQLGEDGNYVLAKNMGVVRKTFCKSQNKDGTTTVSVITVFPEKSLDSVVTFYGKNGQLQKMGQDGGWMIPNTLHLNVFISQFFLSAKGGPPAVLEKGSGYVFISGRGADGGSFKDWEANFASESSISFLESNGVSSVSAGPSKAQFSTDAKSTKEGVGLIEYFPAYSDAEVFVKLITSGQRWSGMTLSRVPKAQKSPLYFEKGQVFEDFRYIDTGLASVKKV